VAEREGTPVAWRSNATPTATRDKPCQPMPTPCQPRANSICTLCAMRRGDAQPWGATARWHGASGGRHAYAPVVWRNHCVGMALRSAEVVREVVRRQGLVRRERFEDSNVQSVNDVSDDRKRQKRPFLKYMHLISTVHLKCT
jgi:hypothetical protein